MSSRFSRFCAIAVALASILALGGCASLVEKRVSGAVDHLSMAVQKQKDPELVRDGAPAFLLIVDGVLEGDPNNERYLSGAAQIYSAYTSAFLVGKEPERAKILSDKARDYAIRAMSQRNPTFAALHDKPYSSFAPCLSTFTKDDVPALFLVVSTWATWIQAHADDMNAIADLAKVQSMTQRLLELDEAYYYGSPHLYMGVLHTLIPAALGGRPEDGKKEFDAAMRIGRGKFVMTYVLYAKQYARPAFDRELHDRLLTEALAIPADVAPELTLVNTLAQREAKTLLDGSSDWFGEPVTEEGETP